ncbi:MAG: hypothetical protein ACLQJR_20845 [Stellaceae bacterium]
MALSPTIIACGAVAVLGAALFASGSPADRARPVALAASPVAAQLATTPPLPAAPSAPAPSVAAGNGITLRSVSVELPSSERSFPGGPAAEAITNNCTGCHSAGMVLTQPMQTPSAWQDIVDKMHLTYKAPIAAEDVPAILDYLTRREVTR